MFERMGVVTQVSEAPAMYERNQAYLNWQRVQQLQEEYDIDDLRNFLAAERERENVYAASSDVASPDAVSIPMAASATDRSIEEMWEAVSAWRTSRRRIQLLERALQPD